MTRRRAGWAADQVRFDPTAGPATLPGQTHSTESLPEPKDPIAT